MALIKGKQLATGSDGIGTNNIVDLNVTTGKLAANAVTAAKAKLDEVWAFTAAPSYNADPSGANDLARKAYVDAVASGLDVKASVRVATAAALPACTAAGSGVGKTLTADAVGVLTVDGAATVLNDRILVKDQVTGANNGIYYVSTAGTAGVAFVLTRATDADQAAEVTAGMFVFAEEGTANADSGFVLTTNNPITVDTTALSFTQFSGAGQITAGAGLTKTGNTIDVIAANASITVNADSIEVGYGAVGSVTTVDAGSAASAGAAATAARIDHEHAVTTGAAGTLDASSTNTEGAGASLARAAHTHAITTGVAGSTIQPDDAAAEGSSAAFARADHKHAIVAAAPGTIQPDDAAAEGTSTSFARADHTHAIAAAAPSNVGTANAEGTSTSFARADHVHDSPAPVTSNKNMSASVTASDNDAATATTVASTPALGTYVGVYVNGLKVLVGNGTKVSVDAYFSGDAGVTARAMSAIVATDTLHWNGSVAGYQLAASDRIDLEYGAF